MDFQPNSSHLPFILLALSLSLHLCSPAVILTLRRHHRRHHHTHHYSGAAPFLHSNHSQCNLFVGNWVPDSSTYPLYRSSDCPFIDPEFNCQLYGRPDSDYLKYRWKPAACDLPMFDGEEFLKKMIGKTVMIVGDSLGRNQWESLICMLYAAAGGRSSTSTRLLKGDPLSTFKFLEYEVAISYYKAPYLVDIDVVQGKRVLKLDDISGNGNAWRGVDVLSFNTGHWWTHTGSLQGWDYMETGGMMYEDMDRLDAMEKGLRTWASWVDANVDPSTTRVFFHSISPTHDNPAEWTTGLESMTTPAKNCYGETEPTMGMTYPADGYPVAYAGVMRVVNTVLSEMSNPPYLMDITMLSAMRKDGHPSIYSGDLSPEQRADPNRYADCSHWCLPGLPDTWNQLFYTALFF